MVVLIKEACHLVQTSAGLQDAGLLLGLVIVEVSACKHSHINYTCIFRLYIIFVYFYVLCFAIGTDTRDTFFNSRDYEDIIHDETRILNRISA